jgi:hypothetical protein
MDSMEPEQTPFAAVSAQTSKFTRVSRFGTSMDDFGVFCSREDGLLMETCSNTKHGLTNRPRTLLSGGLGPLGY